MKLSDNPGQGSRGGQESNEENLHKSSRNHDSQQHDTSPEEEMLKQEQDDNGKEKFSPGEDPDYDAEEFSTD